MYNSWKFELNFTLNNNAIHVMAKYFFISFKRKDFVNLR